jgi:hypothetical protein
MEVAIWLLAKGTVEDRTRRSQPAPPKADAVNEPLGGDVDSGGLPGTPGPRT